MGVNVDRYIWPIGFRSTRVYSGFPDGSKVTYVSEIHDGGDHPKFSVTPQGATGEKQYHSSATAAWTSVIKKIQDKLSDDKKGNTAVSGPEYFGFAHPTIARLIQVQHSILHLLY